MQCGWKAVLASCTFNTFSGKRRPDKGIWGTEVNNPIPH